MQDSTDLYFKLGEMHADIKAALAETRKTNGRVTKLEEEVGKIKQQIAYYAGAAALGAYIIKEVIDRFT